MSKDSLLYRLIELDLKTKGKSICHISDEMVQNPKEIEVGANEVVYTYNFMASLTYPFNVSILSPTEKINFTHFNVIGGSNDLIKAHWGKIKIDVIANPQYFYIQYLRIKFTSNDCEK